MMTFDQLRTSVSEILENKEIVKEGLTIVYALEETNHKKMDEHLFYVMKLDKTNEFVHRDIIELDMEGVTVRIVKR